MRLAYTDAPGKLISALRGKHQPGAELSARAIRYWKAKDFQGTGKGRRPYIELETESLLRFSASVITAWNELGAVDFSDVFNASQDRPFYYRRHDPKIYAALKDSGFNPAQIACAVNKLIPMNLATPRGATSKLELELKAARELLPKRQGLEAAGYSPEEIDQIFQSPDSGRIIAELLGPDPSEPDRSGPRLLALDIVIGRDDFDDDAARHYSENPDENIQFVPKKGPWRDSEEANDAAQPAGEEAEALEAKLKPEEAKQESPGVQPRGLKGTPIWRLPFACTARISKQMEWKWTKSAQYRAQFGKVCGLVLSHCKARPSGEPREGSHAHTDPVGNARWQRYWRLRNAARAKLSSPPHSQAGQPVKSQTKP